MTIESAACKSTVAPPQTAGDPRETTGDARDFSPAPPDSTDARRAHAERVADLFKVLGDPTRVLILQALITADELCVHELAAEVAMSPSAVSHHLRILRHFDLIRHRRDGREIYYRPHDEHVERLIGVCSEHILHSRGMMLEMASHV